MKTSDSDVDEIKKRIKKKLKKKNYDSYISNEDYEKLVQDQYKDWEYDPARWKVPRGRRHR